MAPFYPPINVIDVAKLRSVAAAPCGQGCNVRPLDASGFLSKVEPGSASSRHEGRGFEDSIHPSRHVALRPRGQRALAGEPTLIARQALSRLVEARLGDRGKEAEIDVHRLERTGAGVDRFDMTAGDVVQERADGGGRRRGLELLSQPFGGGEASRDDADRSALDIALAARDLSGESEAGRGLEAKTRVEQARRVEIGVAVDTAEPGEFGLLQPRNHTENTPLLAVFELGLEADHVEQRAERVVLPELDDGVGLDLRIMRVGESERLHRPVA